MEVESHLPEVGSRKLEVNARLPGVGCWKLKTHGRAPFQLLYLDLYRKIGAGSGHFEKTGYPEFAPWFARAVIRCRRLGVIIFELAIRAGRDLRGLPFAQAAIRAI